MFDFEKLIVYQKTKVYNKSVIEFMSFNRLDFTIRDQLKRASLSILLNIAEGTGRHTSPDKKHFYIISRGSVFECAALFDLLKGVQQIPDEKFKEFYAQLHEISRMLSGMIKRYS